MVRHFAWHRQHSLSHRVVSTYCESDLFPLFPSIKIKTKKLCLYLNLNLNLSFTPQVSNCTLKQVHYLKVKSQFPRIRSSQSKSSILFFRLTMTHTFVHMHSEYKLILETTACSFFYFYCFWVL